RRRHAADALRDGVSLAERLLGQALTPRALAGVVVVLRARPALRRRRLGVLRGGRSGVALVAGERTALRRRRGRLVAERRHRLLVTGPGLAAAREGAGVRP